MLMYVALYSSATDAPVLTISGEDVTDISEYFKLLSKEGLLDWTYSHIPTPVDDNRRLQCNRCGVVDRTVYSYDFVFLCKDCVEYYDSQPDL